MADVTPEQENTGSEGQQCKTRIDVWSADQRVLEKLALKTNGDRNEVSEECLHSLHKLIPSPSPSGERTIQLTWSGRKLGKSWKDTFHIVASTAHDVVLGLDASDKLLEAERRSQALLALAEIDKRKEEEKELLQKQRDANRQRQLQQRKEDKRKMLEEIQKKTTAPVA